VHIDGDKLLPYLTGAVKAEVREDYFIYVSDEGETSWRAERRNWKLGLRSIVDDHTGLGRPLVSCASAYI